MRKYLKLIAIISCSALIVVFGVWYFLMLFHSDLPPENVNDWNNTIDVQIDSDILDVVLDLAHSYDESAILYGVSYQYAQGENLTGKSYLLYCPAANDLPNGVMSVFCNIQQLKITNISLTYSESHIEANALDTKLLEKTEENLNRKIKDEWEDDIYELNASLFSQYAIFTAYQNNENGKSFLWEREYNIIDCAFME